MPTTGIGIRVHESATVEPGGFELDRTTDDVTCRYCGGHAEENWEERAEGGSLNTYQWIVCQARGCLDGDPPGRP